ncbi:MAG: CHAT domain-containing protein, partial [Cyanobacteria bacterium P01_G01_bin.19]
ADTPEIVEDSTSVGTETAETEVISETETPITDDAIADSVEIEDSTSVGTETTETEAISETETPITDEAIADTLEIVEDSTSVGTEAAETEVISETETPTTDEAIADSVEIEDSTSVGIETAETEVISETETPITDEAIADTPETTEDNNNIEAESTAVEEATAESVGATEDSEATAGEETTDTETVTNDEASEELIEEAEEQDIAATEETEEQAEISEEEVAEEEALEETEEAAAEEETEEEVAEDNENSQDIGQEVDRIAYEVQVQESPTDIAIQMQEEFQLTQLMDSSGLELYGQIPSVKDISLRLAELGEQTGKNPAFINISLQANQLESFVVLPDKSQLASSKSSLVASADLNKVDSPKTPQSFTLRETIKDTSRKDLIATATEFREEISDSNKLNRDDYLRSAQELYKVLIEPIEAELAANDIDILVFSMDSGLRLLPLAALHDGEQFLIEKYALATVPSFGLTDTRYVNLEKSSILAMGASEFSEQAALPTMEIELEAIVSQPRQGEVFINEQFTIENFKAQNSRETSFPIVHLGTHAEFKAGSLDDSYIQFYDDKLRIPQLRDLSTELGWNSDATPIELLVLSACETALGDEKAELGFAGLAVQAGVKSALASLWYVSDIGTLALMGEFYDRLGDTLIKAEALRQTQLKMLEGNVRVNDKQVELSNGENLSLPPSFPDGTLILDHPYFWSAFTLIGNWN